MGNNKSMEDFEKKLVKGLKEVKKKLLKFKKDKNSPLIISKDGKVVEVDAEDMNKKTEIQ